MYGASSNSRSERTNRRRHFLAVFLLPALFIFFGMSSWMSVNTIWVEMPLLASSLPEQWHLPAYVSIIVQLGNIGPLAMIAVRNKNQHSVFIYLIIACLMVTNLTMAFLFKKILPVGGQDHSVAFLILVFFLALCDCTSSVSFLPYMANFNPRYLVYFFIGQGMGGLVPSALGLIQGSGSYSCVVPNGTNVTTMSPNETLGAYPVFAPPRFGFNVFMFVAVGILAVALLAFVLIDFALRRLKVMAVKEAKGPTSMQTLHGPVTPIGNIIRLPQQLDPFSTKSRGKSTNQASVGVMEPSTSNDQGRPSAAPDDKLLNESSLPATGSSATSPQMHDAVDAVPQGSVFQDGERSFQNRAARFPFKRRNHSPTDFIPDYCLNGFLCFMVNGLLPSIQSYSAMPYGQLIYSLVASLWVAAVPLASWLTMCAKISNIKILGAIGAIGVIPAGYGIALAFLCPTVPLQHEIGGYFLAVFAWFLASAIFFFTRVCVAQRVQVGGHRALFWLGLSTQGASLLGAIVAFLLVPVFHIFRDPQMC